jgi:multisubunit Na+/H+ antiporter MnhB subunit
MLASILRTVVPVVVGTLLGLAAKVGLDLPGGAVTALVTVVLTAAYYWLARLVEQTWPAAGRYLLALGLTGKQPMYFPPAAPTQRDRP